jgi:nucleoside 2-deoxyribosyltransferase
MNSKIFISYSRRDAAIAKRIAHALEKIEEPQTVLTFFDDKDLKAGADFRETVRSNIQSSDAVLVVATSPDAIAHTWTGYEVGIAEALRKPVILAASNRFPSSDFQEDLSSLPIVQFDPERPEKAAPEIAGRLASSQKDA